MSKRERQTAIMEVVREHRIASQEALRERLVERGIDVTQATLSRDIRDLRLVKMPDAEGAGHYALPDEWENTPPLERLLPTLYLSAEGTRNLLVVRTMTGGAQAVGIAIDWEEWPEVLATIAGDDTVLIICREDEQVEPVRRRIEEIARSGER
jgi:transcriptional regulator of arginine metabolism